MAKKSIARPQVLSAAPVKEFFVEMLTRDIALDNAILDLLDNCIDGVVREIGKTGLRKSTPYSDYWAEIEISGDTFLIRDNCGGIPRKRQEYAFRMGRAPSKEDAKLPTVGAYGIGMKRAMFKLGRNAQIRSKSKNFAYTVSFPEEWFKSGDVNWNVKVNYDAVDLKESGTEICVTKLTPASSQLLGSTTFETSLRKKIATYYAFIMQKGFTVRLNQVEIKPKPMRLRFSEPAKGIRPFVFERKQGDVKVFMAVGFTAPIPNDIEANDSAEGGASAQYKAMDAGWTVVCNDRVVLYCDKSMATGWGEADVPRYHNQFIAISGIVEFRSDNAVLLPTTTTKLGVDAGSPIYIDVKNKMREGTRLFTGYTNRWKSPQVIAAGKKHISDAPSLTLSEIKKEVSRLTMQKTTRTLGTQYKPELPRPQKRINTKPSICFSRPRTEIETVSEYLFGDKSVEPNQVGEDCFTLILKEAKE